MKYRLLWLFLGIELAAEGAAPKTLYDRLGGKAAIKAFAGEFVRLAKEDPGLAHICSGDPVPKDTCWTEMQYSFQSFLCDFSGGQCQIKGKSIKSIPINKSLKADDCQVLMGHLGKALGNFTVGKEEQKEVVEATSKAFQALVKSSP